MLYFRSRIFSLNLGLYFAGVALGPMIGSLLIRSTGQVLSVFFLAGSIHLLYALFVWLVVPESLTKERMQISRGNDGEHDPHHDHFVKSLAFHSKKFLDPLVIFMPRRSNNLPKKDWSLTLIAFIYGLVYLLLVCCRCKYSVG